jgi:hypothetical protein
MKKLSLLLTILLLSASSFAAPRSIVINDMDTFLKVAEKGRMENGEYRPTASGQRYCSISEENQSLLQPNKKYILEINVDKNEFFEGMGVDALTGIIIDSEAQDIAGMIFCFFGKQSNTSLTVETIKKHMGSVVTID